MTSHRRQDRSLRPTVLRSVVAATLAAALVTAGALSLAQASPTVQAAADSPVASAITAGPTVPDLLPAPAFPDLDLPELPLPAPAPEPASAGPSDRCDDPDWWNARQQGDPSDYVAACGTWPSWVDRGDTAGTPSDAGAAPYTGPTEGRPWSPEYGYYEGRTDVPKNSDGEPCMQGRDNDDPNC